MNKCIGIVLATAIVSGCGSGGGSHEQSVAPPPVPPAVNLPVAQALRTAFTNGVNYTMAGRGSDGFSYTLTFGLVNLGTAQFEGGVRNRARGTSTITQGSTLAGTGFVDRFYDAATMTPYGWLTSTGEYAVFTSPVSHPVSAATGTTGSLGVAEVYSDSSKTSKIYRDTFTWTTTAIDASAGWYCVNAARQGATSNTVEIIESDCYRVTIGGVVNGMKAIVRYTDPPLTLEFQ